MQIQPIYALCAVICRSRNSIKLIAENSIVQFDLNSFGCVKYTL